MARLKAGQEGSLPSPRSAGVSTSGGTRAASRWRSPCAQRFRSRAISPARSAEGLESRPDMADDANGQHFIARMVGQVPVAIWITILGWMGGGIYWAIQLD